MSDIDSDEEEGTDAEDFSDAEEFSGFGGGEASLDADSEDNEDEEEDDEDMVIQEPSLPSDSEEFDSDDEAGPAVDLRDFVDSLPGSKKRKVEFEETEGRGKDAADAENKKKRRVLPSMQGPGGRDEGGEFGLNPSK